MFIYLAFIILFVVVIILTITLKLQESRGEEISPWLEWWFRKWWIMTTMFALFSYIIIIVIYLCTHLKMFTNNNSNNDVDVIIKTSEFGLSEMCVTREDIVNNISYYEDQLDFLKIENRIKDEENKILQKKNDELLILAVENQQSCEGDNVTEKCIRYWKLQKEDEEYQNEELDEIKQREHDYYKFWILLTMFFHMIALLMLVGLYELGFLFRLFKRIIGIRIDSNSTIVTSAVSKRPYYIFIGVLIIIILFLNLLVTIFISFCDFISILILILFLVVDFVYIWFFWNISMFIINYANDNYSSRYYQKKLCINYKERELVVMPSPIVYNLGYNYSDLLSKIEGKDIVGVCNAIEKYGISDFSMIADKLCDTNSMLKLKEVINLNQDVTEDSVMNLIDDWYRNYTGLEMIEIEEINVSQQQSVSNVEEGVQIKDIESSSEEESEDERSSEGSEQEVQDQDESVDDSDLLIEEESKKGEHKQRYKKKKQNKRNKRKYPNTRVSKKKIKDEVKKQKKKISEHERKYEKKEQNVPGINEQVFGSVKEDVNQQYCNGEEDGENENVKFQQICNYLKQDQGFKNLICKIRGDFDYNYENDLYKILVDEDEQKKLWAKQYVESVKVKIKLFEVCRSKFVNRVKMSLEDYKVVVLYLVMLLLEDELSQFIPDQEIEYDDYTSILIDGVRNKEVFLKYDFNLNGYLFIIKFKINSGVYVVSQPNGTRHSTVQLFSEGVEYFDMQHQKIKGEIIVNSKCSEELCNKLENLTSDLTFKAKESQSKPHPWSHYLSKVYHMVNINQLLELQNDNIVLDVGTNFCDLKLGQGVWYNLCKNEEADTERWKKYKQRLIKYLNKYPAALTVLYGDITTMDLKGTKINKLYMHNCIYNIDLVDMARMCTWNGIECCSTMTQMARSVLDFIECENKTNEMTYTYLDYYNESTLSKCNFRVKGNAAGSQYVHDGAVMLDWFIYNSLKISENKYWNKEVIDAVDGYYHQNWYFADKEKQLEHLEDNDDTIDCIIARSTVKTFQLMYTSRRINSNIRDLVFAMNDCLSDRDKKVTMLLRNSLLDDAVIKLIECDSFRELASATYDKPTVFYRILKSTVIQKKQDIVKFQFKNKQFELFEKRSLVKEKYDFDQFRMGVINGNYDLFESKFYKYSEDKTQIRFELEGKCYVVKTDMKFTKIKTVKVSEGLSMTLINNLYDTYEEIDLNKLFNILLLYWVNNKDMRHVACKYNLVGKLCDAAEKVDKGQIYLVDELKLLGENVKYMGRMESNVTTKSNLYHIPVHYSHLPDALITDALRDGNVRYNHVTSINVIDTDTNTYYSSHNVFDIDTGTVKFKEKPEINVKKKEDEEESVNREQDGKKEVEQTKKSNDKEKEKEINDDGQEEINTESDEQEDNRIYPTYLYNDMMRKKRSIFRDVKSKYVDIPIDQLLNDLFVVIIKGQQYIIDDSEVLKHMQFGGEYVYSEALKMMRFKNGNDLPSCGK